MIRRRCGWRIARTLSARGPLLPVCGEGKSEVTSQPQLLLIITRAHFVTTPQNELFPVGCHAASSTCDLTTGDRDRTADPVGKPYVSARVVDACHPSQRIPNMGTSDASTSSGLWENMDR